MRNAHIISVRFRYHRLLFAPNYITFFHWATGQNILYIYLFFILTTLYNLNESRLSIIMLLQTVFNGTLYIKFGDSEH